MIAFFNAKTHGMKNVALSLLTICCVPAAITFAQGGHNANTNNSSYQATSPQSVSYNNVSTSTTSAPAHYESNYQQHTSYQATPVVELKRESRNESYGGSSYAPTSVGTGTGTGFTTSTDNQFAALDRSSSAPTRYNHINGNYYPCYSSITTQSKSHNHTHDKTHLKPPPPPCDFYHTYLFRSRHFCSQYLYELCFAEYVYDNISYSLPADVAEPAQNVSLDGYIVYDRDTLSGMVTMKKNELTLEQPINYKKEYASTAEYADQYLKAVALYKGNTTLNFARLSDKEHRLWRIVHNGKMMIYDNGNSFLSPTNINYGGLRVMLPGQKTYVDINNKKHLVWCINKAYGLHLRAAYFTWQSLMDYIDILD